MDRGMKHYLDGNPVIPRVYRWGRWRWRGYLGTSTVGVSYGLCPFTHLTGWLAMLCARQMVRDFHG